jgi:hypothetical protein
MQGTEEDEVDLEVQKVLDEVAAGVMSTVPMEPTKVRLTCRTRRIAMENTRGKLD